MLKKILYIIVVIAVIVVLAIMWTDSKKEEKLLDNQATTNTEQQATSVDTNESIKSEMDNINLESGIDADINGVNADIKTL